jgi:uncharacterized protein (DUF2236 family)
MTAPPRASDSPPFPDDSAIRRVSREACMLTGAGRAILLQIAHPQVGQGVSDHSRFTEDPMKRLRGTLYFVYGIALGTANEAEWIAGVVSRIHSHVVGPGYSADDPELQLWVAATLYQSSQQCYELAFGPMPRAMSEELCRQSSASLTLLGCPEGVWPSSVDEFEAYWQRQVDTLEVTDAAKEICRNLMTAKNIPWYFRASMPLNRLLTAGLLPARIREDYELPWNRRREMIFRLSLRALRVVYPRVPKVLRRLPSAYYMRGLRAQHQAVITRAGAQTPHPHTATR